jgi:hypothetical protein
VGNQRSLASLYNAISVAMEQWTVEHRMFAYDAYVQNGESFTAVQQLFRVHFNLGCQDTVVTLIKVCAFVDSNCNNCNNGRKTIRPLKIWIASRIRFMTQMYQILHLCNYDTHACKNLTFILKGTVEKNNCHSSGYTENQGPCHSQI